MCTSMCLRISARLISLTKKNPLAMALFATTSRKIDTKVVSYLLDGAEGRLLDAGMMFDNEDKGYSRWWIACKAPG